MSSTRVFTRSIYSSRTLYNLQRASSRTFTTNSKKQFSATYYLRMPEPLKASEVNSHTDPSVAKQYDNESPKEKQIKDLFELIDGKKIGMLNTYRNGVGKFSSSFDI